MKTVLFAHGKDSGPRGLKIRALSRVANKLGWQPRAIDFRGLDDPQQRVDRLLQLAPELTAPLVLVGSSMGGYVMAAASRQLRPDGLLLMAPAVGVAVYPEPDPQPVADRLQVVHGWQDSVIPVELVIRWCRAHGVPLQLVNDDHVLRNSLPLLESFLSALLLSIDHPGR